MVSRGERQAAGASVSSSRYATTLPQWHGFAKMMSAPASSARVEADWLSPVMTTTLMGRRAAAMIARISTSPEISGRPRSLTTTSKWRRRNIINASWPLPVPSTSAPSIRSSRMSTSSTSGASSITRICKPFNPMALRPSRRERTIDTGEKKPCAARIQSLSWMLARDPCSSRSWTLSERSTDIQNIQPPDPLAVLVEAAGLRDAGDLDLLLFCSRHPRVVLSSEQLAAYVGYELPQVARALDLLLGAGLLKRTLNQGAAGRMYVLEVDHAEEWLQPLQHVCATPDGRKALKVLLKQRQSR